MQTMAATAPKRTESVKAMVDPDIKRLATELYEQIGMSLSTAINVFLRQSIVEGGMPFKPGYPAAPSVDFDDPHVLHASMTSGTVVVPVAWRDEDDDD